MSAVLRNTFDVYKLLALTFLFFYCCLHWLIKKRGDYLISRGSREWREHFKIMALSCAMIFVSFVISYAFYNQFSNEENLNADGERTEERMGKIYVIIGFEVS